MYFLWISVFRFSPNGMQIETPLKNPCSSVVAPFKNLCFQSYSNIIKDKQTNHPYDHHPCDSKSNSTLKLRNSPPRSTSALSGARAHRLSDTFHSAALRHPGTPALQHLPLTPPQAPRQNCRAPQNPSRPYQPTHRW